MSFIQGGLPKRLMYFFRKGIRCLISHGVNKTHKMRHPCEGMNATDDQWQAIADSIKGQVWDFESQQEVRPRAIGDGGRGDGGRGDGGRGDGDRGDGGRGDGGRGVGGKHAALPLDGRPCEALPPEFIMEVVFVIVSLSASVLHVLYKVIMYWEACLLEYLVEPLCRGSPYYGPYARGIGQISRGSLTRWTW